MQRFFILTAALSLILTAGCTLFSPPEPAEEFSVRKVYGDHMVLQRGRPIRICGSAEPGKAVEVSIDDEETVAVAGENGEWVAELPAMEAGGPYTVCIKGKNDKKIEFKDVLIGEVWMCSGQSNMEMPVAGGRFWRVLGFERETANANYPMIRFYNTAAAKSVAPLGPVKEIAGPGWEVCSPATVKKFSAAGYFFGRQLFHDLEVPVGLVNSSWGGTPIESWISKDGYEKAGRTKELAQINHANLPPEELRKAEAEAVKKAEQEFAAWLERFNSACRAESKAAAWKNPDFDDSAWEKIAVPGEFPGGYDGVVWYRKTIDIPESWVGKNLKLELGAVDDCDETFFNGRKIGATGTETPAYWQAKRAYTIPADQVKAGKAVIAVRVTDLFSSGGIFGPALAIGPQNNPRAVMQLDGEWKFHVEFKADLKKIGERPAPAETLFVGVKQANFPATLYNSMIAPWTVYPMRGAIWYQGEANAGRSEDYMTLHPLLIADWRDKWNDPEFAFIFVQLAAFEVHRPAMRLADDFWKEREPADSAWAKLREVQTATLKIPNTGMAVSIDAGDHSDIHPANKQIIGYRLAAEAERICYGLKRVSAGPLYKDMKIEGNKIRLRFTNTGSGLKVKNSPVPQSFTIAGRDGKFVKAHAEIDGDTVLVWSGKVPEPVAVRYAWANYPGDANLYNQEGFPASPFRTDMPGYLLK